MLSNVVKTKLQSLFLCECDCPGHPYVRVCADCIRGIVSFAVTEAVAAEREACAKLAELYGYRVYDGSDVAAAIRARGEEER